jgi:hypothetical protein
MATRELIVDVGGISRQNMLLVEEMVAAVRTLQQAHQAKVDVVKLPLHRRASLAQIVVLGVAAVIGVFLTALSDRVRAGISGGLRARHPGGYPAWWCRVTGGLEMVTALLIALPATRLMGVILGAVIVLVAVVTVVRHRDLSHLAPLGVFATLLVFVFAVR